MHVRTLLAIIAFGFLATAPAWAGPPVICHVVSIGSAQSLPWLAGPVGWNGSDPSYNISHLADDTLKILSPSAPTNVRMETLRRAAIYSGHQDSVARELSSRLIARARNAEAAGRDEPVAFFDAGYFAEALREVRISWHLPEIAPGFDAAGSIRKAIRLGGRNMEQAAAMVEDGRARIK